MKYFFVLGSNPTVSIAEILAVLGDKQPEIAELSPQVLIIYSPAELDTANLMTRLGGVIKVGELDETPRPLNEQVLAKYMADELIQNATEGKIKFGYSIYGLAADGKETTVAEKAFKRLRKAGMETKRFLKEAGHSARWVQAQTDTALSSVVVEKNNLLEAGLECCVFIAGQEMILGRTTAVQPFELFSQVDYGRPERDTYRGMLPPKLARIMLNIAGVQPEHLVWDPFCGSGTVVTEALRLGVKNVFGSDLSAAAVADSKQNIDWMKEKNLIEHAFTANIFEHDARQTTDTIKPGSLNAIVSEPFLGKPQRGGESQTELTRRLAELTDLYRDALNNWRPLLKDGATIVLALPLYIVDGKRIGIDVADIAGANYEIEQLFAPELAVRLGENENNGHSATYGRKDQRVWREIVRLKVS